MDMTSAGLVGYTDQLCEHYVFTCKGTSGLPYRQFKLVGYIRSLPYQQ